MPEPSAGDRCRRGSDPICRAEGLQRITAALSLDADLLSQPPAIVAAIVSLGPTVFNGSRSDPASSAGFKDVVVAASATAASLRDDAAFEAIFESQRRAWRGSAEGVMIDAQIYAQPWGFAIEDVHVPVRLWHGIEDRAFAVRLAEEMANRFPNCKARFIQREGHYSLPIRHMHEILEDLISV
jgi:pimeloyl-ACP methyl ester carboxylesterase